ncbi:TCR/Tet family MFS transporter [Larkinella soli]|uniref:TCR/Tet family MFS transporter n=1 Tax=Larkinella soli TaxID=1770527 RepID=UPI000FFBFBB6|nr:TCR/Tet family MFS transporter [Larkinella soli]
MAQQRNRALTFIFITILIDCTGIGVIIPVTPRLIEQLTGGDLSIASQYGGWLTFSYAIMQFLFSPVLGGLSDRYGRRPVLLVSLLGLGVDYVFLALAPTIEWLFVGRVIAGVCGASFTTAAAYIADVSPPEKRAQNFGLVGAAFGLGFIIGPVVGGVFSQFGVRAPFLIAAGLSLLNALYGYFILPESLSKENRRAFDWRRANPIGSMANLKRYPAIMGMVSALVLLYIAGQAPQSVWTYYTMEKFHWDESWVGYSLGFVGLTVAVVQGGLIRVAIPKLGQERALYVGLVFYIVGFTLFAFATRGWMMFAFMIPYALGGLAGPSIQGLVSTQVPPNEQGELQGALTSLASVTSIVGPLLMTNLFAYFTKPEAPVYFPGAPFLTGAVLTFISVFLVAGALGNRRSLVPEPEEPSSGH